MTGCFLEGAVYELAVSAQRFARDLAATWREAGGQTADLVAGFFENDDGNYYNSAVYVHVEPHDRTNRARPP